MADDKPSFLRGEGRCVSQSTVRLVSVHKSDEASVQSAAD